MKNYYKILGISEEATQREIKNSYKSLALKWHPDKNKNKEKAEKYFKNISEAYQVLSNPQKRKEYDDMLLFKGDPEFDFKFDFEFNKFVDPMSLFNNMFNEFNNKSLFGNNMFFGNIAKHFQHMSDTMDGEFSNVYKKSSYTTSYIDKDGKVKSKTINKVSKNIDGKKDQYEEVIYAKDGKRKVYRKPNLKIEYKK